MILTLFRIICYFMLLIFSLVTLGLTAARIHYTTHISRHDPLHDGVHFYDPIIAEILATAGLTILFTPFLITRIHRRHNHGFISTFGAELFWLMILFILWIVGAAISTQLWGNLGWCHRYSQCRLLTAIVAFTWMSWIMTFFLTVACLWYILKHDGFGHPMHGSFAYPDNMHEREV